MTMSLRYAFLFCIADYGASGSAGPFDADTFEQRGGWFVGRVLRDKLTGEGAL